MQGPTGRSDGTRERSRLRCPTTVLGFVGGVGHGASPNRCWHNKPKAVASGRPASRSAYALSSVEGTQRIRHRNSDGSSAGHAACACAAAAWQRTRRLLGGDAGAAVLDANLLLHALDSRPQVRLLQRRHLQVRLHAAVHHSNGGVAHARHHLGGNLAAAPAVLARDDDARHLVHKLLVCAVHGACCVSASAERPKLQAQAIFGAWRSAEQAERAMPVSPRTEDGLEVGVHDHLVINLLRQRQVHPGSGAHAMSMGCVARRRRVEHHARTSAGRCPCGTRCRCGCPGRCSPCR